MECLSPVLFPRDVQKTIRILKGAYWPFIHGSNLYLTSMLSFLMLKLQEQTIKGKIPDTISIKDFQYLLHVEAK